MPIPTADEIIAAHDAMIHCPDDRKAELGQAVADFIDLKIREMNPGAAPDAKICIQCAMDASFQSLERRMRHLPDAGIIDQMGALANLESRIPALQGIARALNAAMHSDLDKERGAPVAVNLDNPLAEAVLARLGLGLGGRLAERLGRGVTVTEHKDGIVEISIGRGSPRAG